MYPRDIKTKNFHWHMSGQHFRDYHLLLGERKWSRTRLAMGIGTCNVSAAARASRMSLKPSAILKPAGSYFSSAMTAP
jgi:hypothetical protein